ncbi:MAG: hypothetical protein M0Q49_01955 [Porticoccaceae bacterium]|nr:hypothetical protein [Porticoccaceae bacterium]
MSQFSPPVEIAAFIACAYFSVALFNALSRAWFTLRGKPTPQEQQAATQGVGERVSRTEVCLADHARRLEALEALQQRQSDLLREEIDKVFRRVNSVADAVAGFGGELRALRMQLAQMGRRGGSSSRAAAAEGEEE